MEVLTAYVRQQALWKREEDSSEEAIAPPTPPDIQAILTVIGRRSGHHRDVEYGALDLHGADIRAANLLRADLEAADLREANLQDANLMHANLEGADLKGADLRETIGLTSEQLHHQ